MRPESYTTRLEPPTTILFGLVPNGSRASAEEALAELALLADTGRFKVAAHLVQQRRTPDPHSYLGAGKIEELRQLVEQTNAEVVICDDSLSPNQGRHLEREVKVGVLDRSELILHIFATHARTPQAKLQVELATLQYQMPRLKRMWTHLERQRGGIGVRGGAGEKQIDVDRSALRTKITKVKQDLVTIERRKTREIGNRANLFTTALVGYTNAGKSTLMNRLTEAGTLTEDRLFSTLDTLTRPWRLPGGRTVLLSDTVGFIQNLPHQLVASFHATLEEALHADLLLLLVDASSDASVQQMTTVETVLDQLGAGSIPKLYVLNKIDALTDHGKLAPLLAKQPKAVSVSARTGQGIQALEERLLEHLGDLERKVKIFVPHRHSALQAYVRKSITVLDENYDDDGCHMTCLISPQLLQELVAKGAVVS